MAEEEHPQKSALIIGASRGLGLGLSLELLKRGWLVTATVRSAKGGTGLEEYHEAVTMDTLDINNLSNVGAFIDRMAGKQFDVVFINAGITGPENKTAETVSPEDVAHLMMTNAISPVRLATKLLHAIKPETGILAFMTSRLGSVATNNGGVLPLYCASKAALNRLSRSMVETLAPPFTTLNIHPGWVRTEMGGPDADIDVETSVTGIANVLESQSGAGGQQFLDYTGKEIPW